MSIAKILAPLSGSSNDAVVLGTAFAAAKANNAYVDAVFIAADPREVIPVTDAPISGDIIQQLVDDAEGLRKTFAKSARETFSELAAEWSVRVVQLPEKASTITATFRDVVGHPLEALHKAALLSDLVIFPPTFRGDLLGIHQAFVDVLTKCGRPVLLCAGKVPATFGENVLIGWDGGRAAAQALVASVPILKMAKSVRFASVRPDMASERPVKDAIQYLSLHDVIARETVIVAPKRAIAEELFAIAKDHGCDLLVAGGYGHSRLLETIFGGTTERLISHPEIPLLLVH